MIRLQPIPLGYPGIQDGDLGEVVARGVNVHLEVLDEKALMLIVDDGDKQVHLRVSHRGRSPLRVWVYEEWEHTHLPDCCFECRKKERA